MKLIWLSDLHCEFIGAFQLRAFVGEIVAEKPDAVLITGDISNARLLEYYLGLLAELLQCPIYFVLGNHDFYLGGFAQVDALASAVARPYGLTIINVSTTCANRMHHDSSRHSTGWEMRPRIMSEKWHPRHWKKPRT